MRSVIGVIVALLYVMATSDGVAAQPLGGLGSAPAVQDADTPVDEVYCDYALTPNDQPRKAFMEVEARGGATQLRVIGGLIYVTCGCTVEPTGCFYIPTETVFDIQPDGTRMVSANQCARGVLVGNADGSTSRACPSVLRPFGAGPGEIRDLRWDELMLGRIAEGVLLGSWESSIADGKNPYFVAANILCERGCMGIAGTIQQVESFNRCRGMEPGSIIVRGGFCPAQK